MEIDSKLYNNEDTELRYYDINIFASSRIKKNKMIDNFLNRVEKKYKYIYPCDYSKLNFTFNKRKYGIIDIQKKLTFNELEEILLDESLTKIYNDIKEFSSNWLKENFGRGFTGRVPSDFKEYVEYHNLEELLLRYKQRKEKNFSIEISQSNMRKIEEIIQEDVGLLENIIFFDDRIRRSNLGKIEKIFDLLERTNNKSTENVEEKLIELFYLKVLKDFFKECESQLKGNEGYRAQLSKDYKNEEEIQKLINEEITDIEDIYKGDKILKEYFKDTMIIPDEIYDIFKGYETEIVSSINQMKLEALKELQKKVTSKVLGLLKKEKIVTINFLEILKFLYPIKEILREFTQRYIDFQLIEMRHYTMKKIIKDNSK